MRVSYRQKGWEYFPGIPQWIMENRCKKLINIYFAEPLSPGVRSTAVRDQPVGAAPGREREKIGRCCIRAQDALQQRSSCAGSKAVGAAPGRERENLPAKRVFAASNR
jgi:hypothetical protein